MSEKIDLARLYRAARIVIVFLSVIIYLPSITGKFVWDDHVLTNGAAIGGGESFLSCFNKPFLENYYRPFVSASFYIENLFAHRTPLFYHQTNILIHALSVLFLISMLREAFNKRSVALAGGLLFALQPVQVDAVAWIGGRTDSLCALFMILFAWSVIRGARADGWGRTLYLAAGVLAYLSAILTKEQVLPAILLVPLGFRCFGYKNASNKRRIAWQATIPFAAAGALFVLLYMSFGPPPPDPMSDGLGSLVLQFVRSVAYYTLLLFAPTPRWMNTMSLGYFVHSGVWSLAAGTGIIITGVWLFKKWLAKEPAAAWFLAFTVLSLAVVLNLWPVPSMLVTPYRACVSGVGSSALLGWGLARLLAARNKAEVGTKTVRPWKVRPQGAVVAALCTAWYAGLTFWGAGTWRDTETIAATMVRYDPDSVWARLNLCSALLEEHKKSAAVDQLEGLLKQLLGNKVWSRGDYAVQAVTTDRQVLKLIHEVQGTRLDPKRWLSAIYAQLGFARLELKDDVRAAEAFHVGEALYASSDIHLGLGDCALRVDDMPRAEYHLRRAILLEPGKTDIQAKLGKTLAAQGRWKEALDLFKICAKKQPWAGQAYIEVASAQSHLGDKAGAAATLQEALRRSPDRTDIKEMLAKL